MKKLLIIPMLFACYLCIGQTDSASIIGKSIRIGNLVVAQNDFPSMMNWEDAINACKALRNGWRLPTKDELDKLHDNKDAIGGFKKDYYWSFGEDNGGFAWFQSFNNGYQYFNYKGSKIYVRAVRSL